MIRLEMEITQDHGGIAGKRKMPSQESTTSLINECGKQKGQKRIVKLETGPMTQ